MLQAVKNFLVPSALAQFESPTTPCDPSGNLNDLGSVGTSSFFKPICPITSDYSLATLIDTIITYMLYIAGALAVIYLLYSGILYITAGGDETRATKARTGIVNAVIGIIIIVLAFVIEKAAARLFI